MARSHRALWTIVRILFLLLRKISTQALPDWQCKPQYYTAVVWPRSTQLSQTDGTYLCGEGHWELRASQGAQAKGKEC